MIRFIQQFSAGIGDYARQRHKWVDQISFEDIRTLVKMPKKRVKKSRAKST